MTRDAKLQKTPLNFNNMLFLPFLQDLTGLESMDQCRRTLEQHNWNIEVKQYSRARSASLVCCALLVASEELSC